MYKIYILEDDDKAATVLSDFLNQYAAKIGVDIQLTRFPNAFDFLETYGYDADVIFFDIEMPGMNGMEAAKAIRKKEDNAIIVFATNLAQFAVEGYSVSALDFILKPFSYSEMELKFGRIFNELSHRNKQETITINRKGALTVIPISDILYLETKNHSLIYHLKDKEIATWSSLNSVMDKLTPHHFALANSCYLVNLAHVKGIEGNEVVVENERLLMSKGKRKSFLSDLAQYYGGSR